ncbi:MAG: hypothetical protein ACX939_13980, partial [Hyphococcus sp.]
RLIILQLALIACALWPYDSTRAKPSSDDSLNQQLNVINNIFAKRLRRAQQKRHDDNANPFDARCAYDLSEGLLEKYLYAAANGDEDAYEQSLINISAQLQCVSAARFGDIVWSFTEALNSEAGHNVASDNAALQTLLPLTFLMYELADQQLRYRLEPWVLPYVVALESNLSRRDLPQPEVRLYVATDLGLRRLANDEIQRLVESFTSHAWSSGRCRSDDIDFVTTSVGEREISVPVCPLDCASDGAGDSGAAYFSKVSNQPERNRFDPPIASGGPIEEVQNLCKKIQSGRNAKPTYPAYPDVKSCLLSVSDQHPPLTACIVDDREQRRERLFSGKYWGEPRSKVDIVRSCGRSQLRGSGGEVRRQTSYYNEDRLNLGFDYTWVRTVAHYNAAGELQYQITRTIHYVIDESGDRRVVKTQFHVARSDGSAVSVETDYNEAGESKSTIWTSE